MIEIDGSMMDGVSGSGIADQVVVNSKPNKNTVDTLSRVTISAGRPVIPRTSSQH